ncbi:MAG: TonB-dependent receptor [Sideroxydans sp.]|jgi:iron complex outermembrane receptor protein
MKLITITALAISLSVSAYAEEPPTLKEITVTAKSADVAERRDANTQKIILGREEIENLGVMTVGEVLGKLPGVEVKGDGHRARGMSRDSVQILVDGERPAGGSRIVAGVIGRLPSGDLERVEILRGTSAEHGGAASVTVNLIMKKALPKRSTALKAALGWRGNEPNAQFTWTENGGGGGFGWTLPITLNLHRRPGLDQTERQDVTAGTRTLWQKESEDGLFTFREFVLSPRMTWKDGRDTLTVSPLFFDGLGRRNNDMVQSAFADPVLGTGLAYNGDRASREENYRRLLRLRAEGEKHLVDAKLSGRVALNHAQRTVDVQRYAHDAANTLTTSTEHSRNDENEFNAALRLDRPLGSHLLAVGLEHVHLGRSEQQDLGGSFVTSSTHEVSERHSIAWVQDDWSLLPALVLTTGVRGEYMRLNSDAVVQQHGRLLPSLAVRWEPLDKWVMRSSLGAGLKLPRLDEISDTVSRSIAANTPLEADKRGNPNLAPERNLNFEVVLERYLDREAGVFGTNLYVRSTEDFIERRVQQDVSTLRWIDRPYNEGNALHWGWELDGKVRTDSLGWKGATVKAHLTLPHARVNDTRLGFTRMARDTPRYVLSAGVDQSLPAWQSSYGVSLQQSGRSETDIPGEQYALIQARTTFDAFWLYKLTPKYNLRASGQNLLAADTVQEMRYLNGNDSYYLSTRSGGYRSLLVTLEGRW